MKKSKIVLAEDDDILSKVLVEELEEMGFDATPVRDGGKVVSKVEKIRPDLLLLDIRLPNKTGFDILKELKESPDLKEIPVLIITMEDSDDDVKKGLELGAKGYIIKSQHAVGEMVDEVKNFFSQESHPRG